MGTPSQKLTFLLRVTAVAAVALSALLGRPLHQLEHSATATEARGGKCACVHNCPITPASPQPNAPDDHSPSTPAGSHDSGDCTICLTYFLQTLPGQLPPAVQILPVALRQILPNEVLSTKLHRNTTSARGPPL